MEKKKEIKAHEQKHQLNKFQASNSKSDMNRGILNITKQANLKIFEFDNFWTILQNHHFSY